MRYTRLTEKDREMIDYVFYKIVQNQNMKI
jgi:hypothetical protein